MRVQSVGHYQVVVILALAVSSAGSRIGQARRHNSAVIHKSCLRPERRRRVLGCRDRVVTSLAASRRDRR